MITFYRIIIAAKTIGFNYRFPCHVVAPCQVQLKLRCSAWLMAQGAAAEAFHTPMDVVDITDVFGELTNRGKLFEAVLAFEFVHVNKKHMLHECIRGPRLILRADGTEWALENTRNHKYAHVC